MSRAAVTRTIELVIVALVVLVLWDIVYEVVCGFRWTASEGSTKWALILRQFSFRTWSSVTPEFFWLGPNHLYLRLVYPGTRIEALLRAGISLAIVAAGAVALVIAWWTNRAGTQHGDARFGTIAEADSAGLIQPKGLLLGSLNGRLLRSAAPFHVVVIGPTRSGKGVSFVIPNGLTWEGSMVTLDIKQENFKGFGKARFERGDLVFLYAPGSAYSHRYNPLDFVRPGGEMVTDCANIAGFLVATSAETIWSKGARSFVGALLGYVLTSARFEGQRHIRSAVRVISTGQDVALALKTIIETERGHGIPQWVFDEFNQLISIPERTRGGVMFNVFDAFKPWNSHLVCAATETSDFDIRKLRSVRMSIFIGPPLADLETYRPLVRILFQQIHDVLTRKEPGPDEPHRVLLLLDEFFALGKMSSLVSKIPYTASYGFRMAIILQNLSQLDEAYGQATRETIVSGANIKLFVAINDNVTAKYVSESLGSRTVRNATRMLGRGFAAARVSVSEMAAPLMRPQELTRMSAKKSILLLANARPFEVTKVFYYKVRAFKQLMGRAATNVIVPKLRDWTEPAISAPPSAGVGARDAQSVAAKSSARTGDGSPVLSNASDPSVEQVSASTSTSPAKSADSPAPLDQVVNTTPPAEQPVDTQEAMAPHPQPPSRRGEIAASASSEGAPVNMAVDGMNFAQSEFEAASGEELGSFGETIPELTAAAEAELSASIAIAEGSVSDLPPEKATKLLKVTGEHKAAAVNALKRGQPILY